MEIAILIALVVMIHLAGCGILSVKFGAENNVELVLQWLPRLALAIIAHGTNYQSHIPLWYL